MKKKIVGIVSAIVILAVLLTAGILMIIRNRNVEQTGNLLGVSWYNETDAEFTITTAQELLEFARLSDFYTFENQTIKLGADIVVNEGNAEEWKEKAPSKRWCPISGFAGTFDGQGHSISGVYGKSYESPMALFTATENTCTIRDMKLVNSYFETGGNSGTASFSSSGNGNFIKLYSDAIIQCRGGVCGGIVGTVKMQATLEECWFDGTINQTGRKMGGMIAVIEAGRVNMKNCLFSGELHTTQSNFSWTSTDGARAGGLCGIIKETAGLLVTDCLSTGVVTSVHNTYCGSVLGYSVSGAQISVDNTYDGGTSSSGKGYGSVATTGYPVPLNREELIGVKAYQWTALDFDNYWVAVDGDTPILKHFADTSLDLTGVEKAYDMDWYSESEYTFTLTNLKQLYGLALLAATNDFEDVTIELGADIVVNEGKRENWMKNADNAPQNVWYPIGTQLCPFAGTFDGKGHTVSGVYMCDNKPNSTDYKGLFGRTSKYSEIRNLKLTNSYFEFKDNTALRYVGSIAGQASGLIDTVYSDAVIVTDASYVGGIVGYLLHNDTNYSREATANNCWFDGKITGTSVRRVGGIAGVASYQNGKTDAVVNITNCLNTGYISNKRENSKDDLGGQYIGGIVGYAWGEFTFHIADCLSAGLTEVKYETYVGSVVGRYSSNKAIATITNTYAAESAYKWKGTTPIAYELPEGLEISGGVITLPDVFLTGYNGYKFTELDFQKYWAVAQSDTPILKSFAGKVPSLAGVEKMVDTSWYKADAKTMTIDSIKDLYGFSLLATYENFEGKTVKLGKDIVVNAADAGTVVAWRSGTATPNNALWLPIGTSRIPFAGTFDGCMHSINGVYMKDNSTATNYKGLFARATDTSVIKNLKLTNSYFELQDNTSLKYIGSIAGYTGGKIDTVYSDAVIVTDGSHVGGIVGYLVQEEENYKVPAVANNCWFAGEITGKTVTKAGGIVGVASYDEGKTKSVVKITNCLNTGHLSNQRENSKDELGGQYIGGILGYAWGEFTLRIEDCLSAGLTEVKYETYVGSVVGRYSSAKAIATITNTYATEDAYKWKGTTPIAYEAVEDLKIKGGVIILPETFVTGYNGYKFTELDFDTYWAVAQNDTPILKSFATEVPSLTGVEKMVDTSWYKANAKTLTIDSVKELYGFSLLATYENFAGKTVRLGKDIVVNAADAKTVETWEAGTATPSNAMWLSIGTSRIPFAGTFDGRMHSINGIYMKENSTATNYKGLFARTALGSEIKNLKLTNSYFELKDNTELKYVGSIAGYASGNIDTVYSNAVIVTDGANVGGLVGYLNYDDSKYKESQCVNNCWFDGKVTGNTVRMAGGIAGTITYNEGGTKCVTNITNCLNTGEISSARKNKDDGLGEQYIGGIAGYVFGGFTVNLLNCLNTGKVDVDFYDYTASFVGLLHSKNAVVTMEDCYTTRESYDKNGSTRPWTKASALNIKNKAGETVKDTDLLVPENMLLGYAAYTSTTLDFETIWAARMGEIPALRSFVNGNDIVKCDTSWYYDWRYSEKTPYEIDTVEEFYGFAMLVNNGLESFEGKKVVLTADIPLNKADEATLTAWEIGTEVPKNTWVPIGQNYSFKGTFDGNGKTISGVYVNNTTAANDGYIAEGLFGQVSGTIQNFRLEDSLIINSADYTRTGSIVGILSGSMKNVYSNARVINSCEKNGAYSGGLVGSFSENTEATISQCWYDGALSGYRYVGGIAGLVQGGTKAIENCLVTGTVSSDYVYLTSGNGYTYFGGIAGQVYSVDSLDIKECLMNATLDVAIVENEDYDSVGSVVGRVQATTQITDVYTSRNQTVDNATITPIGRKTSKTLTGMPIMTTNVSGENAYIYTELDYYDEDKNPDGVWATVTDNGPVLEALYTGEIMKDVDGYQKIITNWYYNRFSDGAPVNGTEYVISTSGELYGLSQLSAIDDFGNETIRLGADIVLNEGTATKTGWVGDNPYQWLPIGRSKPFAGTFDGMDSEGVMHTISGLYMKNTTDAVNENGLFAWTKIGSKIQNVKLTNSYIELSNPSKVCNYIGSIAGYGCGSLENVYSDAIIITNFSYSGGLVGSMAGDAESSISKCWYAGSLTGNRYVGGITGYAQRNIKTIENCLVTGTISTEYVYSGGGYTYFGGLVGQIHNVEKLNLKNCLMNATLDVAIVEHSDPDATGSVVGRIQAGTEIANVYTTGSVTVNNAPINAIGKITSTTLTGMPIVTTNVTGENAYIYTELDFYDEDKNPDGIWATVAGEGPVLKTLYTGEIMKDVDGYQKITTNWYYNRFSDGAPVDGTEYVLLTSGELYGLSQISATDNFKNDTIRLGADIVLNNGTAKETGWVGENPHQWTPIGIKKAFAGTFNGMDSEGHIHSISGLYIKNSSATNSGNGLFAWTATGSMIQNLKLTNSYLEFKGNSKLQYIGSIIGYSSGNCDTVYSDAIIVTDAQYVGGLVGYSYYDDSTYTAQILNTCWFDGVITGDTVRSAAGIVGFVDYKSGGTECKLELNDCLNTGTISNARKNNNDGLGDQFIGGLIGQVPYGMTISMTNCLNTGKIDIQFYDFTGSLVGRFGRASAVVTVENCYTTNESYDKNGTTRPWTYISGLTIKNKAGNTVSDADVLTSESSILGTAATSGAPGLFGADSAWMTDTKTQPSGGTPILKTFGEWWLSQQSAVK